jgi:MoaA/NifB/PqqE/SkfB family radical SAM enzyme
MRNHLDHEAAAHEKRNWVRLTSMCNNKCTFCLDALAHNETMATEDEIKHRIIEGRRNGATRLILSGGEPTIHPAYIKFIHYGRIAGYRRIQTVTNGRMFSYPEFLARCLDAGLQEITFSIHGANAKVHDALVGVPGAFDEEVEGLRLALADGRPIVNIDVCLNRGNIRRLPELLDRFIAMGVREFDLLHLIPFGNAWERTNRDALVYDIDEAMPYIQAALAYSDRPDVHIWFNRFPPPYLEHYEHLIQDPYKLVDEVRGRFEEYELWITRRMPLSCREAERCPRCYLQNVCDTLEDTMDRVADDHFDAFRVRPGHSAAPAEYARLWIAAPDVAAGVALIGGSRQRLVVELDRYDGFLGALATQAIAPGRIERVIVEATSDLDALLTAPYTFEVQCRLTTDNAAHLIERYPGGDPRLSLTVPNYDLASEAARRIPDLEQFFDVFRALLPVENVPACILGRPPRPRLRVLDSSELRSEHAPKPALQPGDTGGRTSLLDAVEEISAGVGDPAARKVILIGPLSRLQPKVTKGVLDAFGFVREYIRNGYYTRSRRCEGCSVKDTCEGLHISTVRAHGYRWLEPITEPSVSVPVHHVTDLERPASPV